MVSPNKYNLNLDLNSDDDLSELKHIKRQISHEYIPQSPDLYHNRQEDLVLKRRIGSGVAFVSLVAENLLSHPFLVLRRQCQVHYNSKRYHILPFTLAPTIYRIHQHQGLTVLWKGLGSVLLVRGISLGVEDLISKVTPWPKEISWNCTLKQFFQHTLLKCLSLAVVTPFYAASFVETVQSEIASERPGILDVFREGFVRVLRWSGAPKGRMLPIWALIAPTVALGLCRYLFAMAVRGAALRALRARHRRRHEASGALPRDAAALQALEVTAALIANVGGDVAFYHCETIIHRLYLQGTRTIVDNLDNGSSVQAILTNFGGAIDCYDNCVANEGTLGLYKGFGALIMQYAVHIALIQLSKLVLTEIGGLLLKPKKQNQQIDTSPAALPNLSTSHRNYLLP